MTRNTETATARLVLLACFAIPAACATVRETEPISFDEPALATGSQETAPVDPTSTLEPPRAWSEQIKEGREHLLLGRTDMAEQSLLAALAASKQFRPGDVRRRVSLGNLERLAQHYRTAGDVSATARILEAIAIETEGHHASDYPGLSDLLLELGDIQRARGSLGRAELSYRRALNSRIANGALNSPTLMEAYQKLSAVELELGHINRAVRHAELYLELARTHIAQDTPAMAATQLHVAMVYERARQYPEAEALYRSTLEAQRAIEPSSLTEAVTLNGLAFLYLQMDRLDEAMDNVDQSLSLVEQLNGNGIDHAMILDTKAQVLAAQGDSESATQHFREAIAEAAEASPSARRTLYESFESFLIEHDRADEARDIRQQIDWIGAEPES